MKLYSFYELATGRFTGRTISVEPRALASYTPQDCGAIEGSYDRLGQRVDLATGQVVDYQPPAPADSAVQTWLWDAGTRRWVSTPTTAEAKRALNAEITRQMAAIESNTLRAMIALTLDPASAPDRATLQARADEIQALRLQLRNGNGNGSVIGK